MADARSLVAALSMGAAGINMGTRFIATQEAPVHPNVKKALVAASELDTVLVMRALRNTERVLKNKGVDHLLEIEREKGASLKISDIHEQVAGVYPKVMLDGEMDAGAWSCGMVVGLIHDIGDRLESQGHRQLSVEFDRRHVEAGRIREFHRRHRRYHQQGSHRFEVER
jgi:nitronate monooxygenase